MDSKLKGVKELASVLVCHQATVYRMVRRSLIPHRRVGRFIKFTDSDIQSYLDSIKVERGLPK